MNSIFKLVKYELDLHPTSGMSISNGKAAFVVAGHADGHVGHVGHDAHDGQAGHEGHRGH